MIATHKDQLRSMKNVVHSKLNATFRPRPQIQFTEVTMIAPSAPQSECSTLIDFGLEYAAEDLDYGELEGEKADTTLLEPENCAWLRARGPVQSSNDDRSSVGNQHPNYAQMLDVEDRAWDSSKQKRSLPTRILQAFAGQ